MLRTFKNQKMKLLCHLRLIMLAHLVVSIDSVSKIDTHDNLAHNEGPR